MWCPCVAVSLNDGGGQHPANAAGRRIWCVAEDLVLVMQSVLLKSMRNLRLGVRALDMWLVVSSMSL